MIKCFVLCSAEVCLRTGAAVTVEMCCLVYLRSGSVLQCRAACLERTNYVCEVCAEDVLGEYLQLSALLCVAALLLKLERKRTEAMP